MKVIKSRQPNPSQHVEITNCEIHARDGEYLFYFEMDGSFHVNLNGYAILPIEKLREFQAKETT